MINNEELLDELLTGWLDIGVTGATVADTTDFLQLLSHHVPVFAGFRALTTGGMRHNKTVFTAIEAREILDQAVAYLEMLCHRTEQPHQGVYFVAPLLTFGRLGLEVDDAKRQTHMERKIGRKLEEK